MERIDVMGCRILAQQLGRSESMRAFTDAAIFDFGIQDTGRDGASWALANRGVPVRSATQLLDDPDLTLAWTLRGAPHFYRRSELPDVLVATSPLSDKDAGRRIIGAEKPLRDAGIAARDGLAEVASQMRRTVTGPMVKGEVSTRLTEKLSDPYLRYCAPCQAVHCWEQLFRLGALGGGLELEPGTSPPILRRIPGWPRRTAGPADDPLAISEHLQPIRNYLRFLGPATPNEVAAFLDAPVAEIKTHWPEDAIEVTVDGARKWRLGETVVDDPDPDLLRLLGSHDLYLQAKDRPLLVPDKSRHKALWPVIGRPGAVLSGVEIIGTWRPKATGSTFTLRLDLWDEVSKTVRSRIETEAERLAAHRGLTLAAID